MKANRQKDQFWKDTDTWRDEPDFWRKGIMKKLPVLSSLGIVLVTGILLTMLSVSYTHLTLPTSG